MHDKLDKKLCQDFPLLYADRNGDVHTTCLVWGFSCDDGWYQLLYDLSSKLEPLIQKFIDEKKYDPDVYEPSCNWWPRATQVKEKFGSLRFYMSYATSEMHQLIEEAENLSQVTCERCGQPGKLTGKNWLQCLCEAHTRKPTN